MFLNHYFNLFEITIILSVFAIIIMVFANIYKRFVRQSNQLELTNYFALVMMAAAIFIMALLMTPFEVTTIYSIFTRIILAIVAVPSAFMTALVTNKKCYIWLSVAFYASVVLSCLALTL